MKEKIRLDKIAENNEYDKLKMNKEMQEYTVKIIDEKINNMNLEKNFKLLEIGPVNGIMTKYLIKQTEDYSICEGSEVFCDKLKSRYPNIKIFNCLVEEMNEEENNKYDLILLGHVLEHVEEPITVLKKIKKLLKNTGKLITIVPNSNSIHRQAAVIMGMLENQKSLNETDIFHGHRRVYDLEMLEKDFVASGYKIIEKGGYWLKPLSNNQIAENWNISMINAFFELGKKYPKIAAEIYLISAKE